MTYAKIFAHLGLVWAIVALVLLWVAWRSAARGNIKRHRRLMIFLTLGAWVFIAGYLLQYQAPHRLPSVPPEYIPWLAFHGTIGLIPLLGVSALVLARLWQGRHPRSRLHLNRHHRAYGRVFILLWAFTHAGGIANFWLFR